MAIKGDQRGVQRDSGGSEFFVTLERTDFLDGKHTAFGRVISGYSLIENLERTHLSDRYGEEFPIEGVLKDKILSAKVLRKRAHKYRPDRVNPGNESADAADEAVAEESTDDGSSLDAPE